MKKKWSTIAAVIFSAAVVITVAIMMNTDSKPAAYDIKDDKLVISCSFGINVPLSEIADLTLTDNAPEIAMRTNGASIGGMHKGQYNLKDGSKARLYIDEDMPPFIQFTHGDTVFFINADSTEATQSLYSKLQETKAQ